MSACLKSHWDLKFAGRGAPPHRWQIEQSPPSPHLPAGYLFALGPLVFVGVCDVWLEQFTNKQSYVINLVAVGVVAFGCTGNRTWEPLLSQWTSFSPHHPVLLLLHLPLFSFQFSSLVFTATWGCFQRGTPKEWWPERVSKTPWCRPHPPHRLPLTCRIWSLTTDPNVKSMPFVAEGSFSQPCWFTASFTFLDFIRLFCCISWNKTFHVQFVFFSDAN